MKTVSRCCRPAVRAFLLVLAFGVCCAAQSGSAKKKSKDKKSDQATSFLLIHVVGGKNAGAVSNASVYVHLQEKSAILFLLRKHKKVELDLKTDNNGYASFPGLPQGKVLIQVVASGWTPFGEYYLVDQPKQTIQIKLLQPKTHWY